MKIKRAFIILISSLVFVGCTKQTEEIITADEQKTETVYAVESMEYIQAGESAEARLREKFPKEDDETDTEQNVSNELPVDETDTEQNELDELLVLIHKEIFYQECLGFGEALYRLPNSYTEGGMGIHSGTGSLNKVYFYEDTDGNIYFLPESMANQCEGWDRAQNDIWVYRWGNKRYLYLLETRGDGCVITPIEANIVLDELTFLGAAEGDYVQSVEALKDVDDLRESEYTDATVELIHTYFYDKGWYGEYQIYFGELTYNKDSWDEYNIEITVAIVGEETSYYWEFQAKDKRIYKLGNVLLNSDGGERSYPAEYDKEGNNKYAPMIDEIIAAERLVVPLSISKSDEAGELGYFVEEGHLNWYHFYVKHGYAFEKNTVIEGEGTHVETDKEMAAGIFQSNDTIEVSIERIDNSIINDKGQVLGYFYYEKPVLTGDSPAVDKMNAYYDQAEQEWLIRENYNGEEDERYEWFREGLEDMVECYGEERFIESPIYSTVSTRIKYMDENTLSIMQVEEWMAGGIHATEYYGATFDLNTGDVLPITAVVDIDAVGMKEILEEKMNTQPKLNELAENDFRYTYYDETIDMKYEYFYDGENVYIIENIGLRERHPQNSDFLYMWNGKWGEDFVLKGIDIDCKQGAEGRLCYYCG